jgi:mannose-1-phosphate guanylyltransferase
MRYAMIMAGGSGTRLWPVSRDGEPKQLIRFIRRPGDETPRSLLEIAAERLDGLVPEDRQFICTGERYRALIKQRLPAFTDDRILGEPMPRDTVNAVGFAAAVFGKDDPDAVFSVLTADHLIQPADTFARAMDVGYSIVERDPTQLVSFGIKPTFPATGFGYIENGGELEGTDALGFKVSRFVEKPPLDKATEYLAAGTFSWNAGMFVFHANTFMDLLARHQPDSHAGLMKIREAWNTPDQRAVLEAVYSALPKISVDYAVMEPAATDPAVSLAGVTMDVEWLDVGSWPSYGETIPPDAQGNRASGIPVALHDSKNNLIVGNESTQNSGHTIALVGCDDLIVIRTERATLVMPKDRAQDIKALHAELPDELR